MNPTSPDLLDSLGLHGWSIAEHAFALPVVTQEPQGQGASRLVTAAVVLALDFVPLSTPVTDSLEVSLSVAPARPSEVFLSQRSPDAPAIEAHGCVEAYVSEGPYGGTVHLGRLDRPLVILVGPQRGFVFEPGAQVQLREVCGPVDESRLSGPIQGWLEAAADAWLTEDIADLDVGSGSPLALATAAARIVRFAPVPVTGSSGAILQGLSSPVSDGLSVQAWAARWTVPQRDRIARAVGGATVRLHAELVELADSPALDSEWWRAEMDSALRERDDLEALLSLVPPAGVPGPARDALAALDRYGETLMATIDTWPGASEWMWRAAVSSPGSWWTRPVDWDEA